VPSGTGDDCIPQRQASGPQTVYVRDAGGQRPVDLADLCPPNRVRRVPGVDALIHDMAASGKKT